MTLDGAAWLTIFALFGAFLVVTAYIAENWPRENPLDDRSQAHPLHGPSGRSTTAPSAPVRSAAGLDRPLGSLRNGSVGSGDRRE